MQRGRPPSYDYYASVAIGVKLSLPKELQKEGSILKIIEAFKKLYPDIKLNERTMRNRTTQIMDETPWRDLDRKKHLTKWLSYLKKTYDPLCIEQRVLDDVDTITLHLAKHINYVFLSPRP